MIAQEIRDTILRQPGKAYLVDAKTGRKLSYGDLDVCSALYASCLQSQLAKGQTAMLMLNSAVSIMPSILACWRMGVIPAVLDPQTPFERFKIISRLIMPTVVVTDAPLGGEYAGITQVRLDQAYGDQLTLRSFEIELDDNAVPCILLFSSGTTGTPKCVPLSLSNVRANVLSFNSRLGITREDVFLSVSPLWYAHALYNSFLTALFLGATVVYGGVLSLISAEGIIRAGCENCATIVHVTPSMLPILTLIGKRTKQPVPRFQHVICGTAKLDMQDKANFEECYRVPITQQYGMTEVLIMAVNETCQQEKPESVGSPVGCTIEVRDEYNTASPLGVAGDIMVKSASSYGSYYGQADETAAAYSAGWFRTGDIGIVDSDGCLTITGRRKDIIKRGGFSIGAEEIDSALRQVAGVVEAATVGVSDQTYGEEVYTFVVASMTMTEESLIQHCRKFLPRSHIPKRIFFTTDLPKTVSGKIMKHQLQVDALMKLRGS